MKTKFKIIVLLSMAVVASVSVVYLFKLSEEKMRFHNSFTRRFPPHMADQLNSLELKYNSYYFAGAADGKIYLGNTTAPLLVTVLDSSLKVTETYKIGLKTLLPAMNRPQIKVDPPYFYLYEGSIPYIYSGFIYDWKAKIMSNTGYLFSQLQPIEDNKLAVRHSDPLTAENIIGTIDLNDTLNNKLEKKILQKQSDGIFETDGILTGDGKKVVYVYYYRNKFVATDGNLTNIHEGKTIDTISNPKLKLIRIKSKNATTFEKMPLLVNRLAAANEGWLFVNSQLMGQKEPEQMWKSSSIIDIYEIETAAYLASIYIDDIADHKIKSIIVIGGNLYAMGEKQITRYKLRRFLAYPRR